MAVSCDGAKVAAVKQGFFFAMTLSPGHHVLSLEKGVPAALEIHPGEDTFVALYWHYEGNESPIPVLTSVADATAKTEMRFLTYIEKKRIYSATVSINDPRPPGIPQLRTRPPQ